MSAKKWECPFCGTEASAKDLTAIEFYGFCEDCSITGPTMQTRDKALESFCNPPHFIARLREAAKRIDLTRAWGSYAYEAVLDELLKQAGVYAWEGENDVPY